MRLIDAEPIKKFIVDGLNNKEPNKAFGHDAIEILAEIEYAPTIEAAPVVHGRWIGPTRVDENNNKYECSECGFWGVPGWAACPKCTAKMDGGVSDD